MTNEEFTFQAVPLGDDTWKFQITDGTYKGIEIQFLVVSVSPEANSINFEYKLHSESKFPEEEINSVASVILDRLLRAMYDAERNIDNRENDTSKSVEQ
jgi:hypothetical protein